MSKRNKELKTVTKFRKKEVRKVMDWLKSLADPPESFRVTENGHYKIRFSRLNRSGEPVSFFLVTGGSPKSSSGRPNQNLRSTVRQHAILNDVDMSPDYWKDRSAA